MRHQARSQTLRLLAGFAFALALVGLLLARGASPAAADGSVSWDGNGVSNGTLNDTQCDANFTPYLLWIFTGKDATSAHITITENGSVVETGTMAQQGNGNGSFHYTSGFYDLSGIGATVSFVGGTDGNLVISHGCPGGGIVEPGSLHVSKTAISDVCDGTTVTYSYEVSNGSTDFTWTGTLVDSNLGDVAGGTIVLGPGETQQFTATADITGVVTNTATASGTFDDSANTGAEVTTDVVTVTGHTCTISITKSVDVSDVCNGTDTAVTYTYDITNNSDYFDATVNLNDDVLGDLGAINVAAGTTEEVTADTTVTGSVTNTVTADATFSDDAATTASDTASADVVGHECTISIVKTVDVSDVCSGSDTSVTYSYDVTNDSDFFNASGSVTDDQLGAIGTFDLGPGASTTLTKTTTVNGSVTNTGTADATFNDSAPTSASATSDEVTVSGHTCSISVTKTAGTTDVCTGGSTSVTYTYVVENTGDFFSASGNVTDDNGTPGNAADDVSVGSFGPLAPGGTATLTHAATITGTTVNVATANATFADSAPTTATATATATVTGHACTVSLTKTASKTSYCGTSTSVTYTYVVTNTGELFSASGTVVDDNGTPGNAADDITVGSFGPLAPGASATLTRTATITGTVTNVATANATFSDAGATTATATATATVADTGVCPLTPGYWKNHQTQTQALLNTGTIKLGNYQVTTFAQASAIFNAMNCSSSTSQGAVGCLAGHLLAAELNLANGSGGSCIQATVAAANVFLSSIGYSGPSGTYTLTADQRAYAISLKTALDQYNNGTGC